MSRARSASTAIASNAGSFSNLSHTYNGAKDHDMGPINTNYLKSRCIIDILLRLYQVDALQICLVSIDLCIFSSKPGFNETHKVNTNFSSVNKNLRRQFFSLCYLNGQSYVCIEQYQLTSSHLSPTARGGADCLSMFLKELSRRRCCNRQSELRAEQI